MSTSLITGGFGCLGCYLAHALVQRGEEVVIFDVAPGSKLVADICDQLIVAKGDLTRQGDVLDAVRCHNVSSVFHLAALQALTNSEQDLARTFQVNVVGTMNVLEAARLCGVRYVLYASSQGVYGPSMPGPVGDGAPQSPQTMYGVTKVCSERIGEQYHRRYGVDFRGLRFPPLPAAGRASYGSSAFVDAGIREPLLGRPYVFEVAPESRIPTALYVKDAVHALQLLRDAEPSSLTRRVYNINGFSATAGEVAEAARALVPTANLVFQPLESWVVNMRSWPTMDDSCARSDWGWAPAFEFDAYVADLSLDVLSNPALYS